MPVLIAKMFQRLVSILDHYDRRIDHCANGDGDSAQRHNIGCQPHPKHRDKRENDRNRQRNDRHQSRSNMPKKKNRYQSYNDAFFEQLFSQRVDRMMNQRAPIVDRNDLDSFGQRLLDLLKLFLYSIDNFECVLAVAHYHNSANGFSYSVQLRYASANIRSQVNVSYLSEINGRSILDFKDDILEVLQAFDVPATSDKELGG